MTVFTLSCSLTQRSNNGINHIIAFTKSSRCSHGRAHLLRKVIIAGRAERYSIAFTKSPRCSHGRAHLLRKVIIAGRVVVLFLRVGAGDVDVDVVGLQHGGHGRDAGPLLQALDVEAFGKAQLIPLAVLPTQTLLLRHARVLELQGHRACNVHSKEVGELLLV